MRGHWAIENSLHWVLDVTFADDQARMRKGYGARIMAVVRHFAINLVRAASDKKSIKRRRKIAGWNPDFLAQILNHQLRQPGLGALAGRTRCFISATCAALTGRRS